MSTTISEITVMGQLPRFKSKAGYLFPSADRAAITALDEILPVSITNDIEYSGAIVQNKKNNQFSFTYAETQDEQNVSNANPEAPSGMELVGVYHTHSSARNNAENFSFEDMWICREKGVIFWLGTPSKHIIKLVPPSLLNKVEREKFPIVGKRIVLR